MLAERNRSPAEIEDMAIPIGMLKTIHDASLPWLVESFDRLLRLANEPASKSMEVSDTIQATTQNAVGTFKEVVDAFVIVYSGEAVPDEQKAA